MLSAILSRPWFRRLWIVQEVVLSSDATVMIGRNQVSLSLFLTFGRQFFDHRAYCCSWCYPTWVGFTNNGPDLEDADSLLQGLNWVIQNYERGAVGLSGLFHVARNRGASDPHDYVYGILGLLMGPQSRSPDYHISVAELYLETTLQLFSDTKSLDRLPDAYGARRTFNPFQLASWVCEWSQARIEPLLVTLYNASKGAEHRILSKRPRALTVVVVVAGLVSKIGAIVSGDELIDRADVNDVVDKILRWRKLSGAGQSQNMQAILRTTMMDKMILEGEKTRRILFEDMEISQTWWRILAEEKRRLSPRDGNALLNHHLNLSTILNYNKFFVTHKGLIGMAPHAIRRGDRICIAKGSKVPLVLRPMHRTSIKNWTPHKPWKGYLFVGGCYVNGLMDGEAVTPDTEWETVDLH